MLVLTLGGVYVIVRQRHAVRQPANRPTTPTPEPSRDRDNGFTLFIAWAVVISVVLLPFFPRFVGSPGGFLIIGLVATVAAGITQAFL